jgi:uncharacterized protein YdeI (BOF family)
MPDTIDNNEPKPLPPPGRKPRISARALGVGGAVAILIAGAALGAGSTRLAQNWQPQRVMLLQPAPIGEMREDTPVAVKGDVTDIFGNKFVMQDASGRALVDTGPRGEDRKIVIRDEAVSVQGRFDGGVIRAQLIAHADGRNDAFGPPGPKGGPKDEPRDRPKGPKDGPRADRDGPPPPPPPGERSDRGPPPPPADRAGPDGEAPPPPPAR